MAAATKDMSKYHYKPEWYESPIDLPERRIERMEIRHRIIPVGETVSIVGMRQAILRGIKPVSGRVEKPLKIHELWEHRQCKPGERGACEGGSSLWMTDLPEELNQIGEMLFHVQPQGRVLVGGLGLGILATSVALWPSVTAVTVVEKSMDVIKLTGNPKLFRAVRRGILPYLKETKTAFDFYLLDTWAGTNEGTWWEDVMPLKRAIRNQHGMGPHIHCWAEDIMQGQVTRALTLGNHHWYYQHLPTMHPDQAVAFFNTVGSESWEREWGSLVDQSIKGLRRY